MGACPRRATRRRPPARGAGSRSACSRQTAIASTASGIVGTAPSNGAISRPRPSRRPRHVEPQAAAARAARAGRRTGRTATGGPGARSRSRRRSPRSPRARRPRRAVRAARSSRPSCRARARRRRRRRPARRSRARRRVAGSSGVDATLAIRPSSATTSVNVPPLSTPSRTRRTLPLHACRSLRARPRAIASGSRATARCGSRVRAARSGAAAATRARRARCGSARRSARPDRRASSRVTTAPKRSSIADASDCSTGDSETQASRWCSKPVVVEQRADARAARPGASEARRRASISRSGASTATQSSRQSIGNRGLGRRRPRRGAAGTADLPQLGETFGRRPGQRSTSTFMGATRTAAFVSPLLLRRDGLTSRVARPRRCTAAGQAPARDAGRAARSARSR